jgi:hypothetical protein
MIPDSVSKSNIMLSAGLSTGACPGMNTGEAVLGAIPSAPAADRQADRGQDEKDGSERLRSLVLSPGSCQSAAHDSTDQEQ